MIELASSLVVDTAIDAALARLRVRAEPLGARFAALVDATARAAEGGKRMRPRLVAASFDAFGGDVSAAPGVADVAAAFELLHAAFIAHDDVIDHDVERRGIPNVVGEFRARGLAEGADAAGADLLGDAAGILAGDLLLYEALRTVARAELSGHARARILDLLDDAVHVTVAGELADVEHSVAQVSVDAAALLAAAQDKTAVYSFRAPLAAGAVLAGAAEESLEVLQDIGSRLGLAYQLVDDLIGAFGSAEQAGRESGADLREAKQTPLVGLARDSADWPRVSHALAVAHTGPVAVRAAQVALEESGARRRLRELVAQSLETVRVRADDPVLPVRAGVLLRDLADRVEERVP